MSNPRFPDPMRLREPLAPGATAPLGGLTLEQRVAALEQGAAAKERPILYYAGLYLANSGSPTHNSNGNWQDVADGGGTDSWTSICDIRPSGVSAQLDTDTNDGSITCRKSGMYLICYKVSFVSITAGKLIGAGVGIGGALSLATTYVTAGSENPYVGNAEMWPLTSGQVLTLFAYQNDSASEAYTTAGAVTHNRLSIMYIGPSA